MRTILMVCLGNICRSPLAEVVLQHQARLHGLDWKVTSAGTSAYYHENSPADPCSVAIAHQHGLDLTRHRAHQLKKVDLIANDIIYVMDRKNLRDVLELCGNDNHLQSKVKLLLEEIADFPTREVPDPYGKDMHAFQSIFYMIEDACASIIQKYTQSI